MFLYVCLVHSVSHKQVAFIDLSSPSLRPDLLTYHPDCKVYEVREGDRLVALFLSDNYARQFKRSGAWMSEFRSQHKNNEEVG